MEIVNHARVIHQERNKPKWEYLFANNIQVCINIINRCLPRSKVYNCFSSIGNCRCKANVIGRNCNECQNGYFNIVSGNGCETCNCDPIGSFNTSCERFSGQCYCKPGVTGYFKSKVKQFKNKLNKNFKLII